MISVSSAGVSIKQVQKKCGISDCEGYSLIRHVRKVLVAKDFKDLFQLMV